MLRYATGMVEKSSDITRLVLIVTAGALFVVTAVLLTLYPREEWLFEISVSWPLTTIITVYTVRLIGQQMLRAHVLTEQLRYRLQHDALTDVGSRSHFFECLQRDPMRRGVTFLIDVDNFKWINDTHGHLVGDKVLQHVAKSLQTSASDLGLVCRFGGDEFVIFLWDMDYDAALFWAQSACDRLEQNTLTIKDATIPVTVAIGGAGPHQAGLIDTALTDANKALRAVQRNGGSGMLLSQTTDAAA